MRRWTRRCSSQREEFANRVDRLVWQFHESAPEFYQKYQTARAIVDAPVNAKDKTEVKVPATKAA